MKLSYQWLKEFTNEEISEEKMSEILTSVGLEVEHMEKKEAIPGGLAALWSASPRFGRRPRALVGVPAD